MQYAESILHSNLLINVKLIILQRIRTLEGYNAVWVFKKFGSTALAQLRVLFARTIRV